MKVPRGAWIVKWSSHLTFEHWYAMPWAIWSILGDNYSFLAHLPLTYREDGVKEVEKQLLKQLFVKKLLKFVLFMKVC